MGLVSLKVNMNVSCQPNGEGGWGHARREGGVTAPCAVCGSRLSTTRLRWDWTTKRTVEYNFFNLRIRKLTGPPKFSLRMRWPAHATWS